MSECLRISKPCFFEEIASKWKAIESFKFNESSENTLMNIFQDATIDVYVSESE
jgi:hypothetical protein